MTAFAFSRESAAQLLGGSRLGGWALGGSDRGGQDKSRKVRSVGWVRNSAKSRLFANIANVSRNLRFSTTRYRRSTFDTLRRIHERKRRFSRPPRQNPLDARAANKTLPGAGAPGRAEGRRSLTRLYSRGSRFGRGRAASLAASRMLQARGRGAMVKARVVRQMRSPGALRAHVGYLKRDGVTRDGSPGKLFDAAGDDADGRDFAERCEGDRHHFRFIVSPDDAGELSSLRSFTRELMDQASRDLGTRLDWVAVDHWNTEHPHIHILVRGRADDGADLVISRDYIARVCAPAPATSSRASSVRDQSWRFDAALRRI